MATRTNYYMIVSLIKLKGNTTHPAVYPLFENAEQFYGRLVLVNVDN